MQRPCVLPSAALAQPKPGAANPGAQATLLGQFGDWGAYTATPGGHKVCFALSKPTSSSEIPPNRRTAANVVYMFVSTRPEEKVKNEVSMLITGYAFKPNSDATVAIGGTAIRHVHPERRRLGEERGGGIRNWSKPCARAPTSWSRPSPSQGTQTTDTFSLKGISQALDRVGAGMPVELQVSMRG